MCPYLTCLFLTFLTYQISLNIQNMDSFCLNHGWMYNKYYSGIRGLKPSFVRGLMISQTKLDNTYYIEDGGIICLCFKCDCTKILKDEFVKVDLYKDGFKLDYCIQIVHGEEMSRVDLHVEDNCMRTLSNDADVA